jgi:hypothetical protein
MGEGSEKAVVAGGCCFFLLLLIGILVGCSFGVLVPNTVGIDFDGTTQKINEGKLFPNGRHYIGLGHVFLQFPTSLQTVEFADMTSRADRDDPKFGSSSALSCGSKDGQALDIELSFFFRIDTANVASVVGIYKAYRTNYMNTVISLAQDAIKNTAVFFNTVEFFTNRTEISALMHENIKTTLKEMSMDLYSTQLRNIKLTSNFESKVVDKIVSAQTDKTAQETGKALAVKADTGVINQKASTEIAVIRANAQSSSSVMTGSAAASAVKTRIEADAKALGTLKTGLLDSNDQVLQFLWSQTLQNDAGSKLIVGLDKNPVIVSAV